MKKILCMMLAFALCFSMYGTAEENANEEVVSNIVTYGPLSLDISDKWETRDSRGIPEGFLQVFGQKKLWTIYSFCL